MCIFLYVKVKLTLPTDENLPIDTEVAPVNYFLHCLISQVDVSLNNMLITASENTYNCRSYMEAMLNNGKEVKRSHVTSVLFYPDTLNFLERTTDDSNNGLKIWRQ